MDDSYAILLGLLGRNVRSGVLMPDGTYAWSHSQAVELLNGMRSTKIAVLSGEFFRGEPIGLVPAYSGWKCEPVFGESATDFALRSHELAAAQIDLEEHRELYVVLELSEQDDAA